MNLSSTEISISNLHDLQKIQKDFSIFSHVYFRGQREAWPLLPSIARINPRSPILDAEKKMLNEFKAKSKKFLKYIPENSWDWLAVAQNYGLPTRLLDWTMDPFIGLWFTVRNPVKDDKKYGTLWIFTPGSVDIVDELFKRRPFSGVRTKVFVPETRNLDKRINAQKGAFTVHKYIKEDNKFVPLEKNRRYKKKITRINVLPSDFPKLRNELYEKGINDSLLFPDLEGISRTLTYKYCESSDEKPYTFM